jgi:hypothetical protein
MLSIPIAIARLDGSRVIGEFEGFDSDQNAIKIGLGEDEALVPCDEIQAFVLPGEALPDLSDELGRTP